MTKQERAIIMNILINTENCESIPHHLLLPKIEMVRTMLQGLVYPKEDKPKDWREGGVIG